MKLLRKIYEYALCLIGGASIGYTIYLMRYFPPRCYMDSTWLFMMAVSGAICIVIGMQTEKQN